jgi:hypothetical protein
MQGICSLTYRARPLLFSFAPHSNPPRWVYQIAAHMPCLAHFPSLDASSSNEYSTHIPKRKMCIPPRPNMPLDRPRNRLYPLVMITMKGHNVHVQTEKPSNSHQAFHTALVFPCHPIFGGFSSTVCFMHTPVLFASPYFRCSALGGGYMQMVVVVGINIVHIICVLLFLSSLVSCSRVHGFFLLFLFFFLFNFASLFLTMSEE